MTASTSPMMAGAGRAEAASGGQVGTSPLLAQDAMRAAEEAPAVVAGIATQYWDEIVPIPAGNPRLSLFVDNGWRLLQNPSLTVHDLVQRAFLGTDSVVRVWYDGSNIVGLVVSGT
jgi:hypothetical protein